MKTYTDILDLTPWIPDWHDQGACMDRRHILWLRDLLMQTGVQRTLEIGVHTGASASAFIADIGITGEATKRGIIVATRDHALHQIAQETWRMTT